MLSGNDIRKKFIDYFAQNKHQFVKSAPLIPQNDPTLFFTNAGMVPFKNVFTGQEKRDYNRAVSAQKCMRVSGKHNDLENVGRTARHHTFFEMLGNFSFGDYFKKEAIAFAWEFLTKEIGLPIEKLWVSVYKDDDDAFAIWEKEIGVPKNKIKRLGEKDNFWAMGETGPCGPCSEIHYEQDMSCSLNNPNCALGECDCDKYLEIWNLVFMQFDRDSEGNLNPLPKPSIDTGMGLERLTALLQGKQSNYDSDLFTPILQRIQKIVCKNYGDNEEDDVSMRVLADHIRATVFLINDGVLPSNEGRGYVLRRIMRRAIRHGKLLGQSHPFFHKLIPTVIAEMRGAYPELESNQETISKITLAEEERFFETLDKGLKLLSEEIETQNQAGNKIIPGEAAFKLYDTFGFPLDLTELIASEKGLSVDMQGFEKAMDEQKERARQGWKGSGQEGVNELYLQIAENNQTTFLGYETLESPAKIVALLQNGNLVKTASTGKAEVVFDQTPFYGESGGQVGDKGLLTVGEAKALITDTIKPVPAVFVHKIEIQNGTLKVGDTAQLKVNRAVRKPTMRNHTATHIMHAALRKILGEHVRQAGSLVNDKLLRFDFSHFEAVSPEQQEQIENAVNAVILDNLAIEKQEMSYDDAIEKGALAFFGEKYGDDVRVVSIGDYSIELCGGTHLDQASEIGLFKIVSEGSVAAGVRRIVAVTGEEAFALSQKQSQLIAQLASDLKSKSEDIPEKIDQLRKQIKKRDKEIEALKAKLLSGASQDLLKDAFEIDGGKAVYHQTDDVKGARDVATALLDKLKSGVAVVGAKAGPKAILVIAVSKDLSAKYSAKNLLDELAPLVGGRGGGKPEMAQAGGDQPEGLQEVGEKLRSSLKS
ncbi:MAG: alanine--tRNA ligase [Deltaproteobacteria bacterium]|nr:alanine--tRNA ligase [Deltaproteobacteria bacterium]